jgi:hypothetical protein
VAAAAAAGDLEGPRRPLRLLRRAWRASYCCTLKASSTLFLHRGQVQLRFSQEPMHSCDPKGSSRRNTKYGVSCCGTL